MLADELAFTPTRGEPSRLDLVDRSTKLVSGFIHPQVAVLEIGLDPTSLAPRAEDANDTVSCDVVDAEREAERSGRSQRLPPQPKPTRKSC